MIEGFKTKKIIIYYMGVHINFTFNIGFDPLTRELRRLRNSSTIMEKKLCEGLGQETIRIKYFEVWFRKEKYFLSTCDAINVYN